MKDIDDCFERGLLRRTEPSAQKSLQSVSYAREWLGEAEKNLAATAYRSALASAYMAVFHSARAVLIRDGVREKSHYCIGVYLESYVEDGSLEDEWPALFDRMRSIRHTDQYSFEESPSQEEIESGIRLACDFIRRMERLLSET